MKHGLYKAWLITWFQVLIDFVMSNRRSNKAEEKIRINKVGVESLKKIWGIGEKRANLIVHLREENMTITQKTLELLLGKKLSEKELEKIDFAPNNQKFTDKQQKRIGKDDTTLGCTDEELWDIYLKNGNIGGIRKLLEDKKLPTYNTFLMAVDKLSTQTDDLRDFCCSVSNNLKAKIPGAKIVYPAINPKNNRITFVILSTLPSDEKYIDGYLVETKYAYGQCDEDHFISDKEMNEDLCFKSKEDEDNLKINAAGTLRKEGVNDKVFSLTAAHCVFDDDTADRALAMKERDGLAVLEDDKLPHVFKRSPHLQEGSITKMVYGGSPFVDAAL
ncbi:hypothetical protein MAR_003589, partial [Mya arenaria]